MSEEQTMTSTLTMPTPTYTAYERLPDGREQPVAERLRYSQVLAWRPSGQSWAIEWRQDPQPPVAPR